MPRRRSPILSIPPAPHPLEEKVRKLEAELWEARDIIIGLMPPQYAELLRSYSECKSTGEFHHWQDSVAADILARLPATAISDRYGSARANCPLCGSQTSGPYPDGFKIPKGLIQHLTGHGNATICEITEAAFALGRGYIERKFGEAERAAQKAAKEEDARHRGERRKTETVYRVHPFEAPELIDDGHLSWFGELRKADGVAWAEARAKSLGCIRKLEGTVLSLTKEAPNHIVYADIRLEKKITFKVFSLPLPKNKRVWESRFDFPDYFKNEIEDKFDARLQEALGRMHRRS